MYYLERYTRGCPRDLVQSCLHMSAERGFETAKALLQEHFGNETKISAAYIGLKVPHHSKIMLCFWVDATMLCVVYLT